MALALNEQNGLALNEQESTGTAVSITENSAGQDTFLVTVTSPVSTTENTVGQDTFSASVITPTTNKVWPSSLPQKPLLDGLQEKTPNNVVRSQMDRGLKNTRRRSTSNVRQIPMQFILDGSQVITFDNFYNNTTKGGALRFNFTDPRTQKTEQFRFMSKQPVYKSLGNNLYRVEVEMELLP